MNGVNDYREKFERLGENRVALFRAYGVDCLSAELKRSDTGLRLAIAGAYLGIDGEPKSLTALAKQFHTTIPTVRLIVRKTLSGIEFFKRSQGNKPITSGLKNVK